MIWARRSQPTRLHWELALEPSTRLRKELQSLSCATLFATILLLSLTLETTVTTTTMPIDGHAAPPGSQVNNNNATNNDNNGSD